MTSPTDPRVGAHRAHLDRGVACESCHVVPRTLSSPGHIDEARASVPFGDFEDVIVTRWVQLLGRQGSTAAMDPEARLDNLSKTPNVESDGTPGAVAPPL